VLSPGLDLTTSSGRRTAAASLHERLTVAAQGFLLREVLDAALAGYSAHL
jgi:hypothetical protein